MPRSSIEDFAKEERFFTMRESLLRPGRAKEDLAEGFGAGDFLFAVGVVFDKEKGIGDVALRESVIQIVEVGLLARFEEAVEFVQGRGEDRQMAFAFDVGVEAVALSEFE